MEQHSASFILPKIDHENKAMMDDPENWVEASCRYSWSGPTVWEPSFFEGGMIVDTPDRTIDIGSGFEDDKEAIDELLKAGIITDLQAGYLKLDFIGFDFHWFCDFVREKYPEIIGYMTKHGAIQ